MALTGLRVRVATADIREERRSGEGPEAMTQRLALAKARAARGQGGLILGADTVVVVGDHVLGKPTDREDAKRMLESLRGREHHVVTSIALLDTEAGTEIVDTCESHVPMRQFSDSELDGYLVHGNPFDKAGSYAIQDAEFEPVNVDRMEECYANVMGLPLCHVTRNLPTPPPADVPAACQSHTGYTCPIYREVLDGKW